MKGPLPVWMSGTVSNRIQLPGLQPLSPAVPIYAAGPIPRNGVNALHGWIAADQTFTVIIGFIGRRGTEARAITQNSVVDPITLFNVVTISNLHLDCESFRIRITNPGGVMNTIDHHLEVKP